MSGVYARNRKPTNVDFIESAWKLRLYTLKIYETARHMCELYETLFIDEWRKKDV